ncbi:toll-like receptor 5 [Rhinatrema bivittatum]|uniref:toll-like receptor 5 n=1 Tax=Rhinatrema bivittatum TaxID=194408 RepID=UPI00112DE694|nr:toll-like receptor 5 [Rhinatrema bivittatum]XP_029448974.1 toll-like receptor 5 [Rhinatrema bivittatum]XP_029448975.1 toll-like receptor 5 [Rhinatrema bivittatum]
MLYYLAVLLGGWLLMASAKDCRTQNRIAKFYFCNLTQIPSVPNNTRELYLSFNYIIEVNATSFPRLERLGVLELGSQHTKYLIVRKDAFMNLPYLITLDLAHNYMLVLDPDAFAGLSNLRKLLLYYNGLNESVLEEDYFRDLIFLEFVDLSFNHIEHLRPHATFNRLHNLKILALKLNRIATLCEGDLHSFQGKTGMLIDLSDNALHKSDWDSCGNPFRGITFDTLDLGGNGFNSEKMQNFCVSVKGTSFLQLKLASHIMGPGFGFNNSRDPDKDTFAGLADSSLRILDLSRGGIFSLNPHVFVNLTDLMILLLSSNKINQIKKEAFASLHSLTKLNLSDNILGEIYDFTFEGLSNVIEIDLQQNNIGSIQGGAFSHLEKLAYLYLQDNAIKTVNFFTTMPFTYFINLSENKMEDLKTQIHATFLDFTENRLNDLGNLYQILQVQSVQYVILKKNRLSTCYPTVGNISKDNQLLYLDLAENMLQIIWGSGFCLDIFRGLSKLKVLLLDQNHLRFLPQDAFNGLTSLRKLNLSSNLLSYLFPGVFPWNLTILDLSRNQLMSPNPELFTSLSQLDITHNMFICSCELSSLIIWLNQTNVTLLGSQNDIYCVFPDTFYGVALSKIETDDCDEEATLKSLRFSLFVLCSVTLALFIISIVVYTRFRGFCFILYMRIVHTITGDQKLQVDTSACKYDAYLCYSGKDFEWVQNALLKQLDAQYCSANRFHLCFEERDFIPGEDHINNVCDAIRNSKKTICIVTKQFLMDGWCMEAFNFAQSRYFTELSDVLIMVVVGSLSPYYLMRYNPIRTFVQRRQYLRWPEDLQDVDWFLSRLSHKILKEQKVGKKCDSLQLQTIASVS